MLKLAKTATSRAAQAYLQNVLTVSRALLTQYVESTTQQLLQSPLRLQALQIHTFVVPASMMHQETARSLVHLEALKIVHRE
jgi:hypothetical protein